MPNSTPLNPPTASLALWSCPSDDERALSSRPLSTPRVPDTLDASMSPQCEPQTPPPEDLGPPRNTKLAPADGSTHVREMLTPASIDGDKKEAEDAELAGVPAADPTWPVANEDFTSIRLWPAYLSSYFRPGSVFRGTQKCKEQLYQVSVEIKHVDMREYFLCGYLRIQGLTPENPTLTTYFEGEIVGPRYSFITEHTDWSVDSKVDQLHWSKFSAFRPYQKAVKKGACHIAEPAQRDNIFMRWKELFLVKDHRVKTIDGVSYAGFYYICFNQITGTVSGIYFHKRSEEFQQLELQHVENKGCFASMEFR